MRPMSKAALAASLSLLAASAAWAEVSVSYVKPEEYTDVPFGQVERERLQKEFSRYFATLNDKLPAGQNLKIEVLDIDLAGRLYPRRSGGDDLRVMHGGADWPRMKLNYTLEQNGAVLASGVADISNMNYQQRMVRYSDSDPLRYEKQMLDDWFSKTILPQLAGR